MLKKIKLNNKSYILFFQNYDFWNKMIAKHLNGCCNIDIITYNFNFKDYGENSFIRKLCKLIDCGCCVRLLYSKSENNQDLVNNFINKFGIVSKIKDNHSKVFLSDKVAYIGSSNFSFNSNSNLESGFFTTDKKIIKQLKDNLLNVYYTHKNFKWITIPDEFPIILELDDFKKYINILTEIKNKFLENKCITSLLYIDLLTKKPKNIFKIFEFDIDEYYQTIKTTLHQLENKSRTKIDKNNYVFLDALNNAILYTQQYLQTLEQYIIKNGIVELYTQCDLLKKEEKEKFYNLCSGNYECKKT
ncbi:MAG: hypothetical protein E7376_01040 [Clostridiales bacterium]|nr:hypothetical protein [Clostridiales bacterium]